MTPIETNDERYSARYRTVDEVNYARRAEALAHFGMVEIHIGADVYEDEWADDLANAQAWVFDFDFDDLELSLAEVQV